MHDHDSGWRPGGSTRQRAPWALVGVLALEVGTSTLVAADGSWSWRLARLGGAIGIALGALVALDRGRHLLVGLALGAPALATGAALAVAHLGTGRSSRIGGAGAVLAVGGGLLLVGGVISSMRGRRGWRRARGPVAALGALLVAAELVTIPVLVTNVRPTTVGSRDPGDLGLPFREVRIPAAADELAAWFVPPTGDVVVVLLHGSGSTRSATLDHAAVLAGHGYGALLLDARGHGRSGGRAMDLGWQGDADVTAALDWLERDAAVPDDAQFVLVGLSMGGEEAIGAAAADRRVAGVVAEGATGRVAADRDWFSDAYGLRGAVQEVVERAQQAVVDVLTDADPPTSLRAAAAAAGVPMLLVAAGDVEDERLAAEHVAGGSPLVDVWVVPSADHTGGLEAAPEEWERRVVDLVERATTG